MTTTFRTKSFPEILATVYARLRFLLGDDVGLFMGGVIRTLAENSAFADAEQWVQIGKIPKLFSIDDCLDDDLDRRGEEIGAYFFAPLRRYKAAASTVKVVVGDGTLLVSGRLAADSIATITAGGTTPGSFTLGTGEGDAFPSSGAVVLEVGTAREETAVYTRSGDAFTAPLGLAFPHAAYGSASRVSTRSALASGVGIGATALALLAGTGAAWPSSGTVVLDRGTTSEEKRSFTLSGDSLTLSLGTTFAHASGSSAVLSTAGVDRTIPISQVYSPATTANRQVTFTTTSSGVLLDGDFASAPIDAKCSAVGADTNVGSNTVTRFSSVPFSGAAVSNPLPAAGGSDLEGNVEYRMRLKKFAASQARGTALAIEFWVAAGPSGPVFDEETNSRVSFAQVIEPVSPGLSILYVTDGSPSFQIGTAVFVGRDVVISDAAIGDRRGRLHAAAPFQVVANPAASRTPRVFASVNRGSSTSIGVNYLEDTAQSMVTDAFAGMWLKAADDQFYEVASNTAIRFTLTAGGVTPAAGSYAILDLGSGGATHAQISSSSTSVAPNTLTDSTQTMTVNQYATRADGSHYVVADSAGVLWNVTANSATAFTLDAGGLTPAAGAYELLYSARSLPLVPGVDYAFNETTGDLELAFDLAPHDAVAAASDDVGATIGAYTYATGLGARVQRTVNGDRSDWADFPGIRSTGTKVKVAAPTVVAPEIFLSVLPEEGASFAQLKAQVSQVVQAYVNSLGIGQAIVLSEIVRRVKSISGVRDVVVLQPTANVPVGNGQLARITAEQVEVA